MSLGDQIRQIQAGIAAQQQAMSRRAAIAGGAAVAGATAGRAVYGGQSPAPLNAPGALPLGYGIQPGQQNGIDIARVFIAGGPPGTVTGVFDYSGTPGPGNPPVAYMAPPSVTKDPFGNVLPVPGGITSVNAGISWVQLNGGQVNFERGSFISESTSGILVLGGTAGTNTIEPLLPFTSPVQGVEPGTSATAESWHSKTTAGFFPAGWSGRFSWQYLPLGTGLVILDWTWTITVAVTDGQQIMAANAFLNSAYLPASQKFLSCLASIGGSDTTANIQVTTAGQVTYNGPTTAALTLLAGTGIFGLGI